jgi:hypothetical protein
MIIVKTWLILLLVSLTAASAAQPQPTRLTIAAPIALVPGGGTLHVEADDQDGNRLAPGLFTWAVPAGATLGVQEDATGWLLSAPASAASGSYSIPVQYNPNPALTPTAMIVIGKPITAIRILISPQ